jgi:hypothetical protein
MKKCDYCGSRIFFGGVTQGPMHFCNKKCHQNGFLLPVANQLPPEMIQQQIELIHGGMCPKCKGRGPVDVHTSYMIYSAIILTQWSTRPQISCRSCGRKAQFGNLAISLLAGWWGIPWGLIFTPIQVVRNITALCTDPDPARPSAQLDRLVRLGLAQQFLARQKAAQAAPPPSTPPPLS